MLHLKKYAHPTVELDPMEWDFISYTRDRIQCEATNQSKTVKALLIPDGNSIRQWVWVRVPLHPGIKRAATVDELDVDIWMDAARGMGNASSDLTGRSFQINRFPFDDTKDLDHSYTIVVAPQHRCGAHVHPVNSLINRAVPDLINPWRGNVLVFRHGKKGNKAIINVEEKDWTAIEWIVSAVFRKGVVGCITCRSKDCSLCDAFRPPVPTRVLRTRKRGPHVFWTSCDLILCLLRFLNLVQLVNFSHIDKHSKYFTQLHLRGRIARYLSPFFTKNRCTGVNTSRPSTFNNFFTILEATQSWVVGSVALAAASVLSDPICPDNLNLITFRRNLGVWRRFLVDEAGFSIHSMHPSTGACSQAYYITITTSAVSNLGSLFFASPNTDQWIAIGPSELMTPVLENVSEHRHLRGLDPQDRIHPSLASTAVHWTYRYHTSFEEAVTLHDSTDSWDTPCGLSCPGICRSAHGLKGFARVKWGGINGEHRDDDSALLQIGESRLTYRLGTTCDNELCPSCPLYKEPGADEETAEEGEESESEPHKSFTEDYQARVKAAIMAHKPPFIRMYIALMYGAGAHNASYVPVPARKGIDHCVSADDLDTRWWMPFERNSDAAMLDLALTRRTVHHWPFDTAAHLTSSFTICVSSQLSAEGKLTPETPPVNLLFANETRGTMTALRGNVLVVKHGVQGEIVDMLPSDADIAEAIVKSLIHHERRVFRQPRISMRRATAVPFFGVRGAFACQPPVPVRCTRGLLHSRDLERLSAPARKRRDNFWRCWTETGVAWWARLPKDSRRRFGSGPQHISYGGQDAAVLGRVEGRSGFTQSANPHLIFTKSGGGSPCRRPEHARHVSAVYKFEFNRARVTVSCVAAESVLPTLLSSRTTSQMNVLTKTHLVSLYPKMTRKGMGLLAWPAVVNGFEEYIDFGENRPNPGGGTLHVGTGKFLRCGWSCPRRLRQVAGLNGIGVYQWAAGERTQWILGTYYPESTAMYSSLPTEVELRFIEGAYFSEVADYSHVCRQARAVVQSMLSLRGTYLLLRYFDVDDIALFWSALDQGRGGICGSGAAWILRSRPGWEPTNLNAVVATGRAGPIRILLRGKGWAEDVVPSRIPFVYPSRPPRHPIPTLLADSPNRETTWRFKKVGRPELTLTETVHETVFQHIVGALDTMGTVLLTSTTIVALHAWECMEKFATPRAGTQHQPELQSQATWRGGSSGYFALKNGACGAHCPGLLRRMRGGRGIGLLRWRATAAGATGLGMGDGCLEVEWEDAETDRGADTVGSDAYGGFCQTAYAFGWSWCSCENIACETFMFPRDIRPTVGSETRLSNNPKEDNILRTAHAVVHSQPPFPRLFQGLLWPTSCSRAYVVPVPLDHGLTYFCTADDLRVHTWIMPRSEAMPKLPMFMAPHAIVGGNTQLGTLAWREPYALGRYLLIFMTSVDDLGPVNTTVPTSGSKTIHGDVLVMLETDGVVEDVGEGDTARVSMLFSRYDGSWWMRTSKLIDPHLARGRP
ncbi:hypothetical protein C8R47DRAFT_1069598 [Mycena vitilis]|nr:hypothetical protein C8R47DRAFT_1069598 [Mycena vitilis]